MKKLVEWSFLLLLVGCSAPETNQKIHPVTEDSEISTEESSDPDSSASEEVIYRLETYQNPAQDWGYRILENEILFINQPHIPAVPGNSGFQTEEDAQKTANLAIFKIEQGFMPPTISVQELDSLGIVHN